MSQEPVSYGKSVTETYYPWSDTPAFRNETRSASVTSTHVPVESSHRLVPDT